LRELAQAFDSKVDILVIPNGVDTSRFWLEGRQWSSPRILSVGRIVHQKGLDLAVTALGALRDLEWEWRIAGDGPELPHLKERLAREGLEDRVRFLGWRSAEQLIEEYQAASLFVFPSRHEGMPNALLEAMASGLPVIASSIAGNEELVVSGETGLLVQAEDTNALQAALRLLLNDEQRRERMGRAGHARAAEMYGWSAAASQYREMLQKAAR